MRPVGRCLADASGRSARPVAPLDQDCGGAKSSQGISTPSIERTSVPVVSDLRDVG
jgi:hypothetical protein